MKIIKHSLTIGKKKYFYTLKKSGVKSTYVECKDANIAQKFLDADIPELLIDLPELIVAEKEFEKNQSEIIRFRVSAEDKQRIEENAAKMGFSSVSGFLRQLALKA